MIPTARGLRERLYLFQLLSVLPSAALLAQVPDAEMSALASRLSRDLVTSGHKTVAAVDFTNLQGQPTELGRYLSERLSVELVKVGGVSVADRANIRAILAEHRLTEEGLINRANVKKLGEFAGVDAILTGTLTEVGENWELLVKAISTQTAQISAADRLTFRKTGDNLRAGNFGVPATVAQGSSGGSVVSASETGPSVLLHEFGGLRVTLRSVRPMSATTSQSNRGLRLTVEFENRDQQRVMEVALNADISPQTIATIRRGWHLTTASDTLRAGLLDNLGSRWNLLSSRVSGISTVGVGQTGPFVAANPSDIASLLRRRDGSGTDRIVFNQFGDAVQFVFGSMTQIAPGQRLTATLDFVNERGGMGTDTRADAVQLTSDLVVATEDRPGRKSYVLRTISIGRLVIP